jgi:hypothetical protein
VPIKKNKRSGSIYKNNKKSSPIGHTQRYKRRKERSTALGFEARVAECFMECRSQHSGLHSNSSRNACAAAG